MASPGRLWRGYRMRGPSSLAWTSCRRRWLTWTTWTAWRRDELTQSGRQLEPRTNLAAERIETIGAWADGRMPRRPRWPSLVRGGHHEPIPNPGHRRDVLTFTVLELQFPPQPIDIDSQVVVLSAVLGPPHSQQQHLMREDLPGMRDQHMQQ